MPEQAVEHPPGPQDWRGFIFLFVKFTTYI